MAALNAGKVAPAVSLPTLDGKSFSLDDALRRGPVVLAFFKVTCPVCQFTLPYLERIYQAHHGKVSIFGVCQNPKKDASAFAREYGITFPVLLDDPSRYLASNAYGITHVPTIFLISSGGEIQLSSVGWSRADMDDLNRRLAESASLSPAPLFHKGEDVPASKAG